VAADSSRDSTVLNVRISRAKLATFKNLARTLDVSINSVVNSFLSWADAPANEKSDWLDDVRDLREVVRSLKMDNPMVLEEIAYEQYAQRLALCNRLQHIGYIDGFNALQNPRDPNHMICSYKLTTAGLIIARALENYAVESQTQIVPMESEPPGPLLPLMEATENVA
jgi:hypothetical protein